MRQWKFSLADGPKLAKLRQKLFAGGPQGGKAGAMCNESCPCKVSHVQTLPAVVLHYLLQPLLPSLATLHCSELAQNDQLSLHDKYDFKPVQTLQGTLCGLQFSDRVLRA